MDTKAKMDRDRRLLEAAGLDYDDIMSRPLWETTIGLDDPPELVERRRKARERRRDA